MKANAVAVSPVEEQPKVATELLADLRLMYNNPKFSDVTFVCNDGKQVPACRLFLAARSSVLSSMLTNGMAESRKNEIKLPEVSSPVLLSVLEFLYTGAITSLSWKLALEVVVAARYFLLESLEATAWAFLTAASGKTITLMEVAGRLSEALEFSGLWEGSRSKILHAMVKVLDFGCGQDVAPYRFLSELAFRYLLEQTQSEDASACSIATYLRFRQITLWCACQLTPPRDDVVSRFLPMAQSQFAVLQALDRSEAGKGTKLDTELRLELALAVEPWLPMVNLRRLDPALLMRVVKPLNVISPSAMRKLLEFHVWERARELGDEENGGDQKDIVTAINPSGSAIKENERADRSRLSQIRPNTEESTPHLFVTFRVSRDADFRDQIGRTIHFDLVDQTKVKRFLMHYEAPFSHFKERVAKEFGIPVMYQRFWMWTRRVNKTHRPCRPLSNKDESKTVQEVRLAYPSANDDEVYLFLDAQTLNGVPCQPALSTTRHILLFLKLYCPEKEEWRYGGRVFVNPCHRPLDIRRTLINLAGFSENDKIVHYQEVKYLPNLVYEYIDPKSTFLANQLKDGDILCYQKNFSVAERRKQRFPDIPSFLNHIRTQREPGVSAGRSSGESSSSSEESSFFGTPSSPGTSSSPDISSSEDSFSSGGRGRRRAGRYHPYGR